MSTRDLKPYTRFGINSTNTGVVDYETHHIFGVPSASDQILLMNLLNELNAEVARLESIIDPCAEQEMYASDEEM